MNKKLWKPVTFGIQRIMLTLATSCEELTHWKRPLCWEALGAGGEGDDRGWDGWMASPTRCTWIWVNSRSWWWTGRPGMLWFMRSQRVGQDWATELTELIEIKDNKIKSLFLSNTCNFSWGQKHIKKDQSILWQTPSCSRYRTPWRKGMPWFP